MKRNALKHICAVVLSIISFLVIGIFGGHTFVCSVVYAGSRNGGLMYVGNYTTYGITDGTTLSGATATNGGGVYVNTGGTLNISGGAIYGNTATSNGNNIYNAGTTNITAGAVAKDEKTIRYDADGNIDANGKYIYFGSYPQTIKASDVTINTSDVDERGYYLGSDGERYAKFTANPYSSSYVFSDGTTIVSGTDYYFKVEPIKWRILSEDNGQAIILAELILDAHQFYSSDSDRTIGGKTIYANNYKYSDVRSWLNGYSSNYGEDWSGNGFLQRAFTESEQEYIQTTLVDNCSSTTESSSNSYACENTNDKVWLLSYQDMINTDYGFNSDLTNFDTMRRKQTSDYSRANYGYYNTSTDYLYNGNWWSRSSYSSNSDFAWCSRSWGNISYYVVNLKIRGVVPALTISLESGSASENGYGIYNTGELNIYGGSVYDHIYSSGTLNTKVGANIQGTITLADSATITVEDYAGVTPNYKINLSSTRGDGTIITFKGSTTTPDLSKLAITGYDADQFLLKVEQGSSSTEWKVALDDTSVLFPATNSIFNADLKNLGVPTSDYLSIVFDFKIPDGYSYLGEMSTGLRVYQDPSNTSAIAFVNEGKIIAPVDCSRLFIEDNPYCFNELIFRNFDTSKTTNMSSMFNQEMTGINVLDVSCFDTSNVTDMSYMFIRNKYIKSLDLSNFNTSKVTNMQAMFKHCNNLSDLDVSKFDTSKVTDMSGMFCFCSGLTSLDVSKFDTSKVTYMSDMFYSCSGLTSLNVSNFDTSNVTNMSYMFNNCSGLTSLDASNFDTSNVTNMAYMFRYCSGLTSLNVSNFDTSKVASVSYLFYNCSSLTSLDLSSFNMSNVTEYSEYSNMLNFGSSNQIQTLKTPYNNTWKLAITTGSTLYYNGSVVTSVPAGLTASQTYTASASGFIAGNQNNLNLQNTIGNDCDFAVCVSDCLNESSILDSNVVYFDDKKYLFTNKKEYKTYYEPKVYEIA